MAVIHASRVCDWQDNLGKEEMPPQWMWPYEEELEDWFAQVFEARDAKYGRSSSTDGDDGSMMKNDLTRRPR